MTCRVCTEDPCTTVVPEMVLPPFTVVRLGDELWFYVPSSANWNWYNAEQDGLLCWEDLWHQGVPEVVPFDWDLYWWGCADGLDTGCGRVWTREEMARLEPGRPSSAPTCMGCQEMHAWPAPRRVGSSLWR